MLSKIEFAYTARFRRYRVDEKALLAAAVFEAAEVAKPVVRAATANVKLSRWDDGYRTMEAECVIVVAFPDGTFWGRVDRRMAGDLETLAFAALCGACVPGPFFRLSDAAEAVFKEHGTEAGRELAVAHVVKIVRSYMLTGAWSNEDLSAHDRAKIARDPYARVELPRGTVHAVDGRTVCLDETVVEGTVDDPAAEGVIRQIYSVHELNAGTGAWEEAGYVVAKIDEVLTSYGDPDWYTMGRALLRAAAAAYAGKACAEAEAGQGKIGGTVSR
ncbi:hypothetical protein [Roseomonas genomospecies 6]|uniref:Uncharacterized protein n=1 Tax=Roseomonas genomospecies 6 TaxID=214106 RepID=A0A9W7KND1_9PROT|nr:hypothetical protein [Roseomonas genomospecies 6]KAA0676140.1 hypothetical protein DS843_28490 [Roseomonas genomospecies 6]